MGDPQTLTVGNKSSKEVLSIKCGAVPEGGVELFLTADNGLPSPGRQAQEGGVVFSALGLLCFSDSVVSPEVGTAWTGVVNSPCTLPTA